MIIKDPQCSDIIYYVSKLMQGILLASTTVSDTQVIMVVKAFCLKSRAVHFSMAIKNSPLLSAHNSIYYTAKKYTYTSILCQIG